MKNICHAIISYKAEQFLVRSKVQGFQFLNNPVFHNNAASQNIPAFNDDCRNSDLWVRICHASQ
ncbi:hypothetical protein EKG95_27360 [Salmonella enterica subsp. enterica serovar Aqua]|uniref:Uncharacterized protein n=1 Tax=Salmonella enterica subsp. enterica serovar Aqua TaxID=1302615 RepID=A0A5X6ESB3_SALET|nr:hypothetical protein [Salmonella enterica subsp. enterica serovar Aqua]